LSGTRKGLSPGLVIDNCESCKGTYKVYTCYRYMKIFDTKKNGQATQSPVLNRIRSAQYPQCEEWEPLQSTPSKAVRLQPAAATLGFPKKIARRMVSKCLPASQCPCIITRWTPYVVMKRILKTPCGGSVTFRPSHLTAVDREGLAVP